MFSLLLHTLMSPLLSFLFATHSLCWYTPGEAVLRRELRHSEEEYSGEIETRRRVRVRRDCGGGDGVGAALLLHGCGCGNDDAVRCAIGGDRERGEHDSFSVKSSCLAFLE